MAVTFDDLLAMTDAEREHYLRTEVERVIQNAPASQQLKLRHLQAQIDSMRRTIKSPLVIRERLRAMLIEKLFDLQDAMCDLGIAVEARLKR